jgi:hypothetical protein
LPAPRTPPTIPCTPRAHETHRCRTRTRRRSRRLHPRDGNPRPPRRRRAPRGGLRYRPDATPEQIRQVTDRFRGLKEQIPGIVAFEHGINDSPEGKNLGFTHVYLLTFADAAARDTYLPHPEHREFGRFLGELGVLDDAFVVDYVPQP